METHEETNPCLTDDLKFHVLASLLVLIIRQTTYLDRDQAGAPGNSTAALSLTEDEAFLAQLANRLLRVQSYNTHPVLCQDANSIVNKEVGLTRIGNVVNVQAGSVMNHSCDPNTIRINCPVYPESIGGVVTLFVASRNISECSPPQYFQYLFLWC